MVLAVDECVLNVTTALKANGDMWTNSILVLSNDNGGWVGYGGLNSPYRGHKTTLWEGGIRGLGLIVAPGRLGPAAAHAAAAMPLAATPLAAPPLRYEGLFHVTDWMPTLVSAAGGSIASLDQRRFGGIDGVDAEVVSSRDVDVRVGMDGGKLGVEPVQEGIAVRLGVACSSFVQRGRGARLTEVIFDFASQAP